MPIADFRLPIVDADELKTRTKAMALRCLKLSRALPRDDLASRTVADQLIRCACSVAANYRAACRGRSKAEFIAKLGVVIEEADETCFWLEFICEDGMIKPEQIKPLLDETSEILRIVVASRKTAQRNAHR